MRVEARCERRGRGSGSIGASENDKIERGQTLLPEGFAGYSLEPIPIHGALRGFPRDCQS
jgi:hypothetical protein